MAKVVKGARFISKITEVPGVAPTIPPNDDHTLGWKDTDIYVGEWFWNITDGKIYYRDNNGISVVVTPDPSTGQIDPALLPGNYIGAMVYKGVWNASTGNYPGWPYPPTTTDKGNYWIVSVSGNTSLDGETDWQIGDYPIWNGGAWDKIDNSEPTIYANAVLYDNSTYTSLGNVDEALEKIFNEKFITPTFDTTVTINYALLDGTLLQLDGHSTSKWISWNGSTLGLGSNGDSNSILKVGPKTTTGAALTSTLDLHWLTGPGVETLRWKTYSSNTDGYIQGYTDDGGTINTKISAVGDSYFNVGDFGIGTIPSGSFKLEVDGAIGSSGIIQAEEIFKSSDNSLYLGTGAVGTVYIRPNVYNSSTYESIFSTSLATIGTPMTVEGLISGSTISISGNLNAGDTTITGTLGAGNTTITGTLGITSTTLFTGVASYTSIVPITTYSAITHREYVDTEIALHAVGHWASGTTFTPTDKDVIVYNSLATYYVGINKQNPTYNLDVVGNALISSTLDVGGTLNANSDIFIGGSSNSRISHNGTVLFIDNDVNGGEIYLRANDIGGVDRMMFQGNPDGSAYLYYNGSAKFLTTSAGIQVAGAADINGSIDVSAGVNLGSAATNEVVLRGSTVTIANYGTVDSINLMFAGASAFGNQVIAIQDHDVPRKLTLRGQTNDSTYGTTYYGGDLDIIGGAGSTRLISSYGDGARGGVVTVEGGRGGAGNNPSGGNGGAGGETIINGGRAGNGLISDGGWGGALRLNGGIGGNGGSGSGDNGGDGGNVYINAGAGGTGAVAGSDGDIHIGASTTNAITARGNEITTCLYAEKTLTRAMTINYAEVNIFTISMTHLEYLRNYSNKVYRLKFWLHYSTNATPDSVKVTIRKGTDYIGASDITMSNGDLSLWEFEFGATSSTISICQAYAKSSTDEDIYEIFGGYGHGTSANISVYVEAGYVGTDTLVATITNITLEQIETVA